MISLYIHIPFCAKKCWYCNFLVNPLDLIQDKQIMIDSYVESIKSQIKFWAWKMQDKSIKTIYFGWGTPLSIWKEKIFEIIRFVDSILDLSELEELSFELNPNPSEQVLDFVHWVNKEFKKFYRLRFSFGLQSFDDAVLKDAGRDYYFNYIVGFLRDLHALKESNNIFNFDFIAFGKFNQDKRWNKILWDINRLDFFYKFITSQFVDSISLYTLELFPWSVWHSKYKDINQDDIYDEFSELKSLIYKWWYKRYELSNFTLWWKSSIHNRVYWKLKPYIWIWLWASSFIDAENLNILKDVIDYKWVWVRFENTKSLEKFNAWSYIDEKSIINIDENSLLIEEFFLWMRTDEWVKNIERFESILVKDYMKKIEQFQKDWFIKINWNKLTLSDRGMDVYNTVITDLVENF